MFISFVFGYFNFSYNLILNLIIINLTIICFWTFVPGIINYGPGLEIVDLIVNKKIKNINTLKKKFTKGKINKAISNRLKINISSGFLKLKNQKIQLTKKSKTMIKFFEIIKKSFKIKSDAF